jgi:UDP-N-acetylglucosamine 3-dehydrogenase
MGRNHLRVIHDLQDIRLVAVVDENPTHDSVPSQLPLMEKVEDALALGLDCAIIAVPTKFHEDVATKFASAGVPVLIEKPLADTREAAMRIQVAFQESSVPAFVGHVERFNPAIQELKSRLMNGDLGQVYQIATRRQSSFPGRVSDVGVIKDLATHDIDIVLSITQSEYLKFGGITSFQSGSVHEDMFLGNAVLENGTIVSHLVNWLSPLKERFTVVTGENGLFIADTLSGDLTHYKNGRFGMDWDSLSNFRGVSEGDMTRFAFQKREPLKSELLAFFNSVRGNDEKLLATLAEGVRIVSIAENFLEASTT